MEDEETRKNKSEKRQQKRNDDHAKFAALIGGDMGHRDGTIGDGDGRGRGGGPWARPAPNVVLAAPQHPSIDSSIR